MLKLCSEHLAEATASFLPGCGEIHDALWEHEHSEGEKGANRNYK
jgi:hypothetical protein